MSNFKGSSFSSSLNAVIDSLLEHPKQLFQRISNTEDIRHEITGHIFENLNCPKGITKCSECDNLIMVLTGKECKQCKLACHEKCLNSLKFKCAKMLAPARHCFQSTYFRKPTYCKHCGRLIEGFISPQGLKCGHDKDVCMNIHYGCREYISRPCRFKQDTSLVNVSIKDFNFIDSIGSGSSSVVHLVKLKKNDQQFALKVIDKATVNSDPQSVVTEMKVLQYGEYHPFLTQVHCCFQSKERLYFVMEYVDGENLSVHLQEGGKFKEICVRFYSAQIALAVEFLHSKGLVHRDIKPENVIIDRDGHCKLIDYGLARFLDQSVDMKDTAFCGTPYYVSPEMIESRNEGNKSYSFPCDWWSLGVLMYELLFGVLPFQPDDGQLDDLLKSIRDDELLVPINHLTPEAEDILRGLLTKCPKDRLNWEGIRNHPFFRFKDRDGILTHEWDNMRGRRIKPPQMQEIKKIKKPNYEPSHDIINDVITENNTSDPFREFAYMSALFKSKLLNDHSFNDEY